MKRRDFLSAVASSPLLDTLSFEGYSDSEDVDLGIKADSGNRSKRLFKYKYDRDGIEERSARIYDSEEKWFEDIIEAVETMGFSDHCVWDMQSTSLVYCAYFTNRDYQTLLYQIEPDLTIVSVHQFGDHIEVAGEKFETTNDALAEIQKIGHDLSSSLV